MDGSEVKREYVLDAIEGGSGRRVEEEDDDEIEEEGIIGEVEEVDVTEAAEEGEEGERLIEGEFEVFPTEFELRGGMGEGGLFVSVVMWSCRGGVMRGVGVRDDVDVLVCVEEEEEEGDDEDDDDVDCECVVFDCLFCILVDIILSVSVGISNG